jgi:hypothetical protein
MARKPNTAPAADVADKTESAEAAAPASVVSVTILAEGVKVDGAGNLPVGISVMVTAEQAAALKAAGQAE